MIYPDLYALLYSDPEARQRFETLPAHTRGQIKTHASNSSVLDSLKDFSENVTRGEG